MGFFSAVKKFFGKKTPDAERTESGIDASKPGQSELVLNPEADVKGLQSGQPTDENIAGIGESEASGKGSPIVSGRYADNMGDTASGEEAFLQDGTRLNASTADETNDSVPQSESLSLNREKPRHDGAQEPGAAKAAAGDEAGTSEQEDEDARFLLALRNAEPRLSSWLDIVLQNQDKADERFWKRLSFLLSSLEAPPAEIDAFVSDFSRWLQKMEYVHVDEFRSELQYRLALALDLEDEEDERNRLLIKLEQGLAATRARLGQQLETLLASHSSLDDAFWDEMEELFITADMGYETSLEIVKRLKKRAQLASVRVPSEVGNLLHEEFVEVFKNPKRIKAVNRPEVVLMMGVNGAGKTTTIAKLAYRDRLNGKRVLVVAADTFRAAAMEQLKVWADRVGADFYQKPAGSDPAAVAWEGMDYALKSGIDVVYIDTAGRLQTRVNLMEELGKIRQVLGKKHPGSPHRNVLVLDATTGQNALSQAKLFKEGGGADEIILTKLDGTAKGGVAIAVAMREEIPITYIGIGEKMEDLRPFDSNSFAGAILNRVKNAA